MYEFCNSVSAFECVGGAGKNKLIDFSSSSSPVWAGSRVLVFV